MLDTASQEWLAGRVSTLLSHWPRQVDARLEQAAIVEWLNILGPLPQWAVQETCLDYLREKTFRPVPADIYRPARAMVAEIRAALREAEASREVAFPEVAPPSAERVERIEEAKRRIFANSRIRGLT